MLEIRTVVDATSSKVSPANNNLIVPAMIPVLATVMKFVEDTQKDNAEYVQALRKGEKGVFRKPDTSDIALQVTTQTLDGCLRKNKEIRLQKALCVINEINDGWDGACKQCFAQISLARIKDHFALLCKDCLEEIERKEKMSKPR